MLLRTDVTKIPEQPIDQRIRELIADEMSTDIENVTDNAHLVHDLGVDSLDYIELIIRCEEEWEIDLDDLEDLEDIADVDQTVRSFIARVEERINADAQKKS